MCGLTKEQGVQVRAVPGTQTVNGHPSSEGQGCVQEALPTL